MRISNYVPQLLLLFFFAYMLITQLKLYYANKSFQNQSNLQNLIIGLTFIVLMLVWGGFFTPSAV